MNSYRVGFLGIWIILSLSSAAWSGECLETRSEMLANFRSFVNDSIRNPDTFELYEYNEIEKCWHPIIGGEELDEKLADQIVATFKNNKVPLIVKQLTLNIAENAAPKKLFFVFPELMKSGAIPSPPDKQDENDVRIASGADVLLSIWARYGKKDKVIASFDYFTFLKTYNHKLFQPPYEGRDKLYRTLAKIYEFDYPSAKKMLIDWRLFNVGPRVEMYDFLDPRAIEDAGFAFKDGTPIYKDYFYEILARHLELEIKDNWLNRITKRHSKLLYNGILATYGFKITDKKMSKYFATEIKKFCRNGKCGKTSNQFDDSRLTDIDKNNLEKLKVIETRK